MTPKEKALEIVKRMYEHTGWLAETKEGFDKQDIKCALICVDEILKLGFIFYGDPNKENNPEYWEEVKEQITLL